MKEVVIVSGIRTPIADFAGSLKSFQALDLGAIVAKEALHRAGIKPEHVDNLVGGHCMQAGTGGNVTRQVQAKVGIPWKAPAVTVHQACGSSMRALEIASEQIMLGKSEVALVIGTESMSNTPYVLKNARNGYRLFHANDGPWDELLAGGLICPLAGYHMGITAENLAEQYEISREEQDQLAELSHMRAIAAINNFKEEIVPVEIKTRKGTSLFDTDEHPRKDLSLEKLAKLPPAFKKNGTVTAGNASGLNDGAAAAVIMSREKAEAMGLTPLAVIRATSSFGVEPTVMGIGPAFAIPKVLQYARLELKDIDYFEINEAFAAQFLAVNRELKLDMEQVNANGSGISLGHPVGMTGIRLVISLVHEMKRRGVKRGCASLCCGGGPAIATVIESI